MLEMIIGALLLLVGVVVGFGISSVSTEKALEKTSDMNTIYNGDVTNHYGEMPQELTYSEDTLFTVRDVLLDRGHSDNEVSEIITRLQNAGILFRERAK